MSKADKKNHGKYIDTNYYVKTVGYFTDGKQTGMWINYSSKGVKSGEFSYENGKLNGPYRNLFGDNSWSEGTMVNDTLQGKYYTYADSLLISELDYSHGAIKLRTIHLKGGIPNENLQSYLEKRLHKYYSVLSKQNNIKIKITIAKNGSIIRSTIVNSISPTIDSAIQVALLTAPAFIPAYYDKTPIELKTTCIFNFNSGLNNKFISFLQGINYVGDNTYQLDENYRKQSNLSDSADPSQVRSYTSGSTTVQIIGVKRQ